MRVEGLNKVLKNIDKKSKEIQDKVHNELVIGGEDIRTDAISLVPQDNSILAGSIQYRQLSKFEHIVFTKLRYAPYVEFGTGAHAEAYLADKSAEMKRYAMTFYVNGKGRLPAKPYMFPAFEQNKNKIYKRIKKAVESK